MKCKYGDTLHYCEVHWLSKVQDLLRFLSLLEVITFLLFEPDNQAMILKVQFGYVVSPSGEGNHEHFSNSKSSLVSEL
jgi:hypothetical protein